MCDKCGDMVSIDDIHAHWNSDGKLTLVCEDCFSERDEEYVDLFKESIVAFVSKIKGNHHGA